MSLIERRRPTFVAFMMLLSSQVRCGGFVHIPVAPYPTGPIAERREYLQQYRAVSVEEQVVTAYVNGRFQSSVVFSGVRLANRELVQDPNDLRPAIGPQSQSALALDRLAQTESIRTAVVASGAIGLIGGALLAFFGATPTVGGGSNVGVFVTGFSLGSAGLITLLTQPYIFAQLLGAERERAFIMYNESLREAVGLCGDGTHLGDCANATPSLLTARRAFRARRTGIGLTQLPIGNQDTPVGAVGRSESGSAADQAPGGDPPETNPYRTGDAGLAPRSDTSDGRDASEPSDASASSEASAPPNSMLAPIFVPARRR